MKTRTAPLFLTAALTGMLLCASHSMQAREIQSTDTVSDTLVTDGYSDIYLDTVKVSKKFITNDYSLIGAYGGVCLNRMSFNPSGKQETFYNPGTFGVSFTKFCKMFGLWPYFGFTVAFNYSHEGYKYKSYEKNGVTYIGDIEGYSSARYDVMEIPLLTHIHFDVGNVKLMGNIGLYGGYRTSIERGGTAGEPNLRTSFTDYDIRFDYGLQGGAGLGFMFDPIEIHFNGMVRYGWSSLWKPDFESKYYWRYATPFDIMITAGIYYQLTKRHGKTSKSLKEEARRIVYGE